MNYLIQNQNSGVITLKEITDLIDVRHDRAMQKVDELCLELSFGTVSKIDIVYNDKGQTIPTYLLTKKQAIAVGAKLNNTLLMKVIDKVEELENKNNFQIPQTLSQALLLASQQAEQIEKQNQLILEQKPKVDFFEAVTGSKDAIDIGTVAKVLNKKIGRNKLFEILRDKNILMASNMPYQKFIDCGYFRVIETKYNKPDGSTHIGFKTLVYQKGVNYINKIIGA